MAKYLNAKRLKELILDDSELALLDVREEGVFAEGHILWAASVPLSRLELLIDILVPRLSTPIVIYDNNDGLSERAAAYLSNFSYLNIAILNGGIQEWEAAGNLIFEGINVPSKAFGEFIEKNYKTPKISARDLKKKIDSQEDIIILDSRPFSEFNNSNIPGGIDIPGAELVYRIYDVVPSSKTLIVVNCAGSTRSIIGAQSLINAGIANDVVALNNGVMGWELEGFPLEYDSKRRVIESSSVAISRALSASEVVARKFGIKTISQAELGVWENEKNERTLYLFDVRNPEEYEAGHLAGSVSAPGGQLVQAIDVYAATQNSRIVLIDDNGIRATLTASWLVQMGWKDVVVLRDGLVNVDLKMGPKTHKIAGINDANTSTISAKELKQAIKDENVTIIDLGNSLNYREGHIPNAWFAIRSRLKKSLQKIPIKDHLVLTSEDGIIAQLSINEIKEYGFNKISYLSGGTAAWIASGFALACGEENMADKMDDIWLRPHQRLTKNTEAAIDYLASKIVLLTKITQDGTSRFQLFKK